LVAFQPHMVSRTKIFGAAMGRALGAADMVVVLVTGDDPLHVMELETERFDVVGNQARGITCRIGDRSVARDHRQRQDVELGGSPGEQQRQRVIDAGIGIR